MALDGAEELIRRKKGFGFELGTYSKFSLSIYFVQYYVQRRTPLIWSIYLSDYKTTTSWKDSTRRGKQP